MSAMKPVIKIHKQDSNTAIFSTQTFFPFYVDNKRWPTILHYVYAQRCESQEDAEELRKQETIFQLKRKYFSLFKNFDLSLKDKKSLETAYFFKFTSGEKMTKLLVETYPATFSVGDDAKLKKFAEKAILKVQRKLYLEHHISELPLVRELDSTLTQEDVAILKFLFEGLKIVKTQTDAPVITPEMVRKKAAEMIVDSQLRKEYLSSPTLDLTVNEQRLLKLVEKMFSEFDPLQKYSHRGSIHCILFLRWIYATFGSSEAALQKDEIDIETETGFEYTLKPITPPYPTITETPNPKYFKVNYSIPEIPNRTRQSNIHTLKYKIFSDRIVFVNSPEVRSAVENIIFDFIPQYEKMHFAVHAWFRRLIEKYSIEELKREPYFPSPVKLLSKIKFDDYLTEIKSSLSYSSQTKIDEITPNDSLILNQWMGFLFCQTADQNSNLKSYFKFFEEFKM